MERSFRRARTSTSTQEAVNDREGEKREWLEVGRFCVTVKEEKRRVR
jgi:hypothetical protein